MTSDLIASPGQLYRALENPTFSGRVTVPAGSVTFPGLTIAADPDTGMTTLGDDRITLVAGGVPVTEFQGSVGANRWIIAQARPGFDATLATNIGGLRIEPANANTHFLGQGVLAQNYVVQTADVDRKRWRHLVDTGGWSFQSINDAQNVAATWLYVERGTGTAIQSVRLFSGAEQEALRVNAQQNIGIGTVGSNAARLHAVAPGPAVRAETTATSGHVLTSIASSSAYATGAVVRAVSVAAGSTGYDLLRCDSANGSDTEARIDGVGTIFADGASLQTPADYAEYFETASGLALPVGISVVLENDKVRPATPDDDPDAILGVTRPKIGNASLVANAAAMRWANRFMRDAFGAPLYQTVEWVRLASPDGEVAVRVDELPEMPPVHADRFMTLERVVNPAYDPEMPYVPRALRDEWVVVGLLGQIPLRQGQPTGSRWRRMASIDAEVDLWFIR